MTADAKNAHEASATLSMSLAVLALLTVSVSSAVLANGGSVSSATAQPALTARDVESRPSTSGDFWQQPESALAEHPSAEASSRITRVADAGEQGIVAGRRLAGGNAAADTAEARERFVRRPYGRIGAGITELEPRSPTASLSVSDDTDRGFHIGLGYDLTRMVSAELYLADLGSADLEFLGAPVGDVGYRVFGLSGLLYLLNSRDGLVPFSSGKHGVYRREGLSLFVKGGIGGMSNNSRLDYRRDYDMHASFGAGLEYGFANGFGLRTDLTGYDNDARYLSVSLVKRFGKLPSPLAAVPAIASVPESTPASVPTIVMPTVHFAFDSSEISRGDEQLLDDFVDQVLDQPFALKIIGHTDSVGSVSYNQKLSERRAEAVRRHLQARGIEGNRLTEVGQGENSPVESNDTAPGRAANRRVDILQAE